MVLRVIPIGVRQRRRARPAAGAQDDRFGGARPRPRHRHHRQRQVDHAGGAGRSRQRHALRARHDGRGPDRVPAPRQPVDRQPARGRRSTRGRSRTRCGARCARTPTSSSSAKCATTRRSRRRCSPRRPATWCSRRCTRSTRRRPSTASSRCFPPHQQKQIRMQLASVLKAVVSQRLLPRADGKGRAAGGRGDDHHAVHPRLHRGQGEDAPDPLGAIAAGTSQYGMQTFDQAIFGLYEQRLVTYDEALRWATNKDEFKLKVQGISTTADETRDQMARSVTSERRPHVRPDHAVRAIARARRSCKLGPTNDARIPYVGRASARAAMSPSDVAWRKPKVVDNPTPAPRDRRSAAPRSRELSSRPTARQTASQRIPDSIIDRPSPDFAPRARSTTVARRVPVREHDLVVRRHGRARVASAGPGDGSRRVTRRERRLRQRSRTSTRGR